jgi:amino acid adenylation domain-containing protein
MQEGMLYHSLKDPDSTAYFEQMSFRLQGEIDADLAQKSINEVMKRYDILRTLFILEGTDRPLQVVLKERDAIFHYEDLTETAADKNTDVETQVEEYKERDRRDLFDLSRDVLVRLAVLKVGEAEYEFVWSYHHILMDGWCYGIVVSDFWTIYTSLCRNEVPRLPEVTPYSAYIAWLEKQDREESKLFWQKYLEGYQEAIRIPRFKERGENEKGYKNVDYGFLFNKEETGALKDMAVKNQVTFNTVVQTVWGVLLAKYNNRRDAVFCTVVSGRPSEIKGVESMVGLFINSTVMRIRWEENTTFSQLIRKIQKEAVESEPHHYYPLADVQSATTLKQDLTDHVVLFQNYPTLDRLEGMGNNSGSEERENKLKFTKVSNFDHTHYDLCLFFAPGEELAGDLNHNGHAYDIESIARIAGHFRHVVEQVLADGDINVDQLDLAVEAERKQVLEDFNSLKEENPSDKTIHQMFEEQVEKTPDGPAVKSYCKGARQPVKMPLTYSQLNEKANQLAHLLRKKGVTRDSVVGLMGERSTEIVIATIAILKAGGAFLPVDAEFPENRKKYMLENGGISVLVTNFVKEDVAGFVPPSVEIVDVGDKDTWSGEPKTNLPHINEDKDLVYVLHTSGSTGKPKGVMLEHRNVVNLMRYQFVHTNIDNSRILQFSAISVDVYFHELFSALLSGGSVYLIDKDTRTNIPELFDIVRENEIKTMFLPMSFLKLLFSEEEYIKLIPSCVDHIQTAGERVVVSRRFQRFLKENNVYLHNHYGPAETHVVTALTLDPREDIPELPSIGVPILNTPIYIVDKLDRPLPVGVPGELLIGGIQVGRGYIGREDLTAERFVDNPFIAGEKLYRSGDLARWLPDGNIDFLGRIDMQVKIRGFRIEPGEVESMLLNHPKIKEAIVYIGENEKKEKFLCAYFVSPDSLSPVELREYLSREIPGYMIPDYFIQLDEMPLLPNRKIDYKALPDPRETAGSGISYEPPANETEEKIIEIWADVLDLDKEQISRNDDFFQMGGNSLNILKVLSRVNKVFENNIDMSVLFLYPRASELAANIHQEGILNQLDCIVRLNKGANERNLFIVHPAHGMIYQYKELAKLLENDFNVYGIQARGLVGSSRLSESFDIAVVDYLQQIKQVQPEGPYIIGAYCFGDLIAYDMIRLMEDMGDQVEKFIMLDEHLFVPAYALDYQRWRDRIFNLLKWIPGIEERRYKRSLMHRYEDMVKKIREDEAIDKERASSSAQSAEESQQQEKIVDEHLDKLMADYYSVPLKRMVKGIIKTDIINLKAEIQEMKREFSPRALAKLTYGKVEIFDCPGDHNTILEKPNVQVLADLIKDNVQLDLENLFKN